MRFWRRWRCRPFHMGPRCSYTCSSMPFAGGVGYCSKPKGHSPPCNFSNSDERSDPSITTA